MISRYSKHFKLNIDIIMEKVCFAIELSSKNYHLEIFNNIVPEYIPWNFKFVPIVKFRAGKG